ncbi:hypothetical protein predicted by Glimmer/Critica [Bordetella petrii]|uniref:Uncharacterized protein n=1 Tax=Bordetella petrii (strain ATCC BAA-461 / DSM 12804 / CCUG 43448 / CIP 107267 / Se-1111R) TaxID=340100 RepID=A9HWQ7_BORPD|nr:hypothetical protein predicted by Glimmer/Critica [Bordetella petrii]
MFRVLRTARVRHRLLHDLSRIAASGGWSPELQAAECASQASRIIRALPAGCWQADFVLEAYMQGLSAGFYDIAEEGMPQLLKQSLENNLETTAAALYIGYHHGSSIRQAWNSR